MLTFPIYACLDSFSFSFDSHPSFLYIFFYAMTGSSELLSLLASCLVTEQVEPAKEVLQYLEGQGQGHRKQDRKGGKGEGVITTKEQESDCDDGNYDDDDDYSGVEGVNSPSIKDIATFQRNLIDGSGDDLHRVIKTISELLSNTIGLREDALCSSLLALVLAGTLHEVGEYERSISVNYELQGKISKDPSSTSSSIGILSHRLLFQSLVRNSDLHNAHSLMKLHVIRVPTFYYESLAAQWILLGSYEQAWECVDFMDRCGLDSTPTRLRVIQMQLWSPLQMVNRDNIRELWERGVGGLVNSSHYSRSPAFVWKCLQTLRHCVPCCSEDTLSCLVNIADEVYSSYFQCLSPPSSSALLSGNHGAARKASVEMARLLFECGHVERSQKVLPPPMLGTSSTKVSTTEVETRALLHAHVQSPQSCFLTLESLEAEHTEAMLHGDAWGLVVAQLLERRSKREGTSASSSSEHTSMSGERNVEGEEECFLSADMIRQVLNGRAPAGRLSDLLKSESLRETGNDWVWRRVYGEVSLEEYYTKPVSSKNQYYEKATQYLIKLFSSSSSPTASFLSTRKGQRETETKITAEGDGVQGNVKNRSRRTSSTLSKQSLLKYAREKGLSIQLTNASKNELIALCYEYATAQSK